jgi:uncharacterized membrane protein
MIAKSFFEEEEQKLIVRAIKKAEEQTSGEIRVHLAGFCFGDELKAAQKIFSKLKMHETRERNGILIYIAPLNRKIAVIGDVGIHEKLGNEFWNGLVKEVIRKLQANRRAEAIAQCVEECGRQLAHFFPRSAGDKNELSNNISF